VFYIQRIQHALFQDASLISAALGFPQPKLA